MSRRPRGAPVPIITHPDGEACVNPYGPRTWCFSHCLGWKGYSPMGLPLDIKDRAYVGIKHWPECTNPNRLNDAIVLPQSIGKCGPR